MGFKLNNKPYDESDMNIPVYKRNIQDGAIGKSNHTGIVVQEGLDPLTEKAVIAHETVHQKDPHLDYDDDNFYYKGKTYPREKLNEFNRELPWEKKAYAESDKILEGKVNDIEMEKFKIGEHRGNKKPFAAMSEKGLVGPSMEYTVSGGEDPDVITKSKTKVKKFGKDKGTVVTKTKYVNTKTGEKGGSTKKVGPIKGSTSLSGNITINKSTTTTPEPNKPTVRLNPPSSTPGTDKPSENKPYVKPIKKTTYREAYEKTDKSEPFEVFKEKAIKWNKENKPSSTPPSEKLDLPRMTPRQPVLITQPKSSISINLDPSSNLSQKVSEESWKKRKGKSKVKVKKPPTSGPPRIDPPLSTDFSNACTKEGTCGRGQLYSSGMFGSPTRKDIRQINKMQRQYNKAGRQSFREQMKPIRQKKRQQAIRDIGGMFKKDTSYQGNYKPRKGRDMRPLSVKLGFRS